MPKICYIEKNFKVASLIIIGQANEIIEEYQADGLDLTLRQLYYQFVSRDLIANKQAEYKRLGSIISDARLAGLVDWRAIEDRTRGLKGSQHWENPGEIIKSASYGFKLDHWEGQDFRPEIWIEKEALVGVISKVCRELDVDYFACKGYVSQSEMWSASQRFNWKKEDDNQTTIIIHLGDHDPSGMDMTRDIEDRQTTFLADIQMERIALNMDQVTQYNPPPNPAKLTDTRAGDYIAKYGSNSWELDALDPKTLSRLIREKVMFYRDEDILEDVIEKETEYKAILQRVEENWVTL